MTTSTHRHPKWGEGQIIGWFDQDMVMFKSNHGKTMLREATLTPLEQSQPMPIATPQTLATEPPELQPPQTFTPAPAQEATPEFVPTEATPEFVPTEATPEFVPTEATPEFVPTEAVLAGLAQEATKNPRQRKKQPAPKPASTKLDLNKVKVSTEISDVFPRLGKIGAKKLFDKTPSAGWVSLNSVRDFCGDLFPTQESWDAFTQLFEVN
jgi:hypothetical protein